MIPAVAGSPNGSRDAGTHPHRLVRPLLLVIIIVVIIVAAAEVAGEVGEEQEDQQYTYSQ